MTGIADVLGQASERRVAIAVWIGEHPVDGSDVAHLLIYPMGHRVADRMRALAGLLGVGPADGAGLVEVAPDTTWLSCMGREVGVHYGESAWLHGPVTAEWAVVAAARGWVILSVGLDGWTGRTADLDRYVSRPSRLYLGRVRVVPE